MKKIAVIASVAVLLNVSLPMMPQAHAASLMDTLNQVASQSQNAVRVQQLLALKQSLEQGNSAAVVQTLAQEALNRSGQGTVVDSLVNTGNLNGKLAEAVQAQIQQKVSEKIGPYEQQASVISMLLGGLNSLNPQAVKSNNTLLGAPQNYRRAIDMTATAYGPGYPDNGKWGNQTYMGGTVKKGVAAVDPNVIPMGTKLWIEGYGEAVATDQGSAIQGNSIDLAFDTRQQALDYGIQNVKVYVLN